MHREAPHTSIAARTTRLLIAVSALLAGWASPAHADGARSFSLGRAEITSGPALAGDEVLYGRRQGLTAEIRALDLASGRTRVVRSTVSPGAAQIRFTDLAASTEAYAARQTSSGGREPNLTAVIGGLMGQREVATLEACTSAGPPDVEGRLVAVGGCGASLIDLDVSGAKRVLAPSPANLTRVSRAFAAFVPEGIVPRGTSSVVVHDLARARELYRLAGLPGSVVDLDVQSNGSVAYVLRVDEGPTTRSRVYVATAAAPRPRRVALAEAHAYTVRAARGRLAVARRTSAGSTVSTVLVQNARGRFVVRSRKALSFAFDGRRTAWITRAGKTSRLHVSG